MSVFPIALSITLIIIVGILIMEYVAPDKLMEGFSSTASLLTRDSYWGTFASPRVDISPTQEDPRYTRDIRYFNGYEDVTRLGVSYDFCRMISPKDDDTNLFFACALAGTENLSSTAFRTASLKDGFRISRDDYMRDINKDGRADYCRILLNKDNTYQPLCQKAGDIGFEAKDVIDPSPPSDIQTLLSFYDGCVLWLRLMDDMKDTVDSVDVHTSGGLSIDEIPSDSTTGLVFNGVNQYLRLSDSGDFTLGTYVPLRDVRTWMVWVKYDVFANNSKIFDFGNGSGQDNVFMGILGKGDEVVSADIEESTVPTTCSGQQAVEEVSPQVLMKTSDANVDEYTCGGFEIYPRKLPGSKILNSTKTSKQATLLYEVWDKQTRKMRIKVNSVIPLKTWTHICITASDSDAFRPTLVVYINGKNVLEKSGGFLPSTGSMTNCYIGKSNWNTDPKFVNKDELFKGSLFDFRAYQKGVSEQMIEESIQWGKERLGINS